MWEKFENSEGGAPRTRASDPFRPKPSPTTAVARPSASQRERAGRECQPIQATRRGRTTNAPARALSARVRRSNPASIGPLAPVRAPRQSPAKPTGAEAHPQLLGQRRAAEAAVEGHQDGEEEGRGPGSQAPLHLPGGEVAGEGVQQDQERQRLTQVLAGQDEQAGEDAREHGSPAAEFRIRARSQRLTLREPSRAVVVAVGVVVRQQASDLGGIVPSARPARRQRDREEEQGHGRGQDAGGTAGPRQGQEQNQTEGGGGRGCEGRDARGG